MTPTLLREILAAWRCCNSRPDSVDASQSTMQLFSQWKNIALVDSLCEQIHCEYPIPFLGVEFPPDTEERH